MRLSTRLTVAMGAMVVLTAAVVGLISYFSVEGAVLPRVLGRMEMHTRLASAGIEAEAINARADVVAMSGTASIAGIVRAAASGGSDPEDGASLSRLRARVATNLVSQLATKPSYGQFRLIGVADGGREIVRVDRGGPGGAVRIVADADLQARGDEPYFKEAIGLSPGATHVSSISLDREGGVLVQPHVPVMRVATPIAAVGGSVFGILILDVDMRRAFASVRAVMEPSRPIFVVDENGDYLLTPDGSREFGFDLGKAIRLEDDFPELATALKSEVTTTTVVKDRSDARFAVTLAPRRLADGPLIAVVETVSYAEYMAVASTAGASSLWGALIAAVGAIVLGSIVARSLAHPLVEVTAALDGFARGEKVNVPTQASGEIGVLARAFAAMAAEVGDKAEKLTREVAEHRRTGARLEHVVARERLFSAALESSDDAVLIHDLDGKILAWNPAAERLYGYSADEALGRKTDFIIPPDHAGESETILRKVRGGENLTHFETVRVSKAGRRIDVSLSISPVRAPTGEIIGASKIARDITDRRSDEEKFRLAVEASPSGVVMTDAQGHIVFVNAETERLFGYGRDELLGKSVDVLVPDRFKGGHPGHRGAFVADPKSRIMGAGRDLFGLHKDGSEFPVEVGLNPIRTREGLLVLSVIIDITERKLAEEKFRLAVEACPSGIVMADAEGRIVLINAETERLFGYDRQELIGQPVDVLVPPRFQEAHPGLRAGFVAHPGARTMGAGRDLYGLRKDGSEFPVEVGLNPIRTPEGLMILSVIIDIGARKQAEAAITSYTEDLKRSNAELEQFAYVAAHDLQEPLRMVASYTELLAERYKGRLDERADKYIHYAVDGAKRMKQLISDLLVYSRVGTQGKPLVPVQSGLVLNSVLQRLRATIMEVGADVSCGSLPTVNADEVQFGQLLQNLIANAVKFRSQESPRIAVEAKRRDGEWVFSVSDNGIGIDPQYAERIFQMFQRLHERGRYEGSGIGLAIAKKIVERHGGRIWFTSQPGEGTSFYFTMPALRGEA